MTFCEALILGLEAWSELNVSREEEEEEEWKGLCSKGREKRIVLAGRAEREREKIGEGERERERERERGSQFRKSISELSFPDCPLLAAQTEKKGRLAGAGEFGRDFYFAPCELNVNLLSRRFSKETLDI